MLKKRTIDLLEVLQCRRLYDVKDGDDLLEDTDQTSL